MSFSKTLIDTVSMSFVSIIRLLARSLVAIPRAALQQAQKFKLIATIEVSAIAISIGGIQAAAGRALGIYKPD